MSLFNSQTIFSILVTLLIGAALYYYIKYKYRILELTQREQAKVLQSVIMSMNNNNHNLVSMIQGKSNEELVSESIAHDMNRFSEVNKTNELIDVSDDDDESDSGSESGSDCGSDSESGSDSENDDDIEGGNNNNNSTTKKILFTGNHDSHLVEHLEGPDVKIIELSHPLYSKNENDKDNEMYNKNTNHDDEDQDQDDDECSSDNDSESDSESVTSDIEGHEIHEIHEIKENTVTIETNNQNDLETENISDNISEVISVDNSLDNLLVKAVFKNKDSETHADYNSMNVQSLRQLLKNKLASDGSNMSESSINKLTKKDLIKHLS
jgi:hypothetical protein